MTTFIYKLRHQLLHLRLQPIRVYCLHHVSTMYDADCMNKDDWMHLDEFKRIICDMQKCGIKFISLSDAYHRLCHDWVRIPQYAVITFDDGYASLKEVLPWLQQKHIPVTLFINGKYLDGKSFRKNPKEQYLSYSDILDLSYSIVEIGSHGWEHTDATNMSLQKFVEQLDENMSVLSQYANYIPFHAYTWGRHNVSIDKELHNIGMIPVLMDGMKNYNDKKYIHRELLAMS